ncbi:MAG TPA: PP2C family protein-serine/threonine phosphatase [Marmoricola sp.]
MSGLSLRAATHSLADQWRSGTARSQTLVLGALLVLVTGCFAVSLVEYTVMPIGTYTIWLLGGLLLLRFRPLLVLTAYVVVGASALAIYQSVRNDGMTTGRISGMIALLLAGVMILVYVGGRRTGLPTPLGEAMLADLRGRLLAQGRVPPLPEGWRSQSSMIAAHGVGYAGDFMTVNVDDERSRLEIILVDVVGKGVAAGTDALHFAGALGGLIGAMPPEDTMRVANAFLLRQPSYEAFATAVMLQVDLSTGAFTIVNAGHPPVLRWQRGAADWEIDRARGTALGVLDDPELHVSTGHLGVGDALLFYTDGVVEERGADIDDRIAWLKRTARDASADGFEGATRRIIRQVRRGDDDRAVFVLWRP